MSGGQRGPRLNDAAMEREQERGELHLEVQPTLQFLYVFLRKQPLLSFFVSSCLLPLCVSSLLGYPSNPRLSSCQLASLVDVDVCIRTVFQKGKCGWEHKGKGREGGALCDPPIDSIASSIRHPSHVTRHASFMSPAQKDLSHTSLTFTQHLVVYVSHVAVH